MYELVQIKPSYLDRRPPARCECDQSDEQLDASASVKDDPNASPKIPRYLPSKCNIRVRALFVPEAATKLPYSVPRG